MASRASRTAGVPDEEDPASTATRITLRKAITQSMQMRDRIYQGKLSLLGSIHAIDFHG
jgi:hypothetical protein